MKAPKTDVAPYSPSGTCNAKIMIMLILYSGRSNNTTEGSDDLEQS